MSGIFSTQNSPKQEDAIWPLLCSFALECSITMVPDNEIRLQLIGTHQLLACAGDVNLLGNNISTIKIKHTRPKRL